MAEVEKLEPEKNFRNDLRDLINLHNMERGSNTPDFILAEYLINCLEAFDNAIKKWAH